MEKENIVKAISNPDLARRAAAALKKTDPGPLELVHTESDSTLGYDATCCIHHNGADTYVIASDFGDVNIGYAMMWAMSMAGGVFGLSGQAGRRFYRISLDGHVRPRH